MTTDEDLVSAIKVLGNAYRDSLPTDVGFVIILCHRNGEGAHEMASNLEHSILQRALRSGQRKLVEQRSRVLRPEDFS